MQEGAGTGKAKVPKPLGAGSRFSETQVKWGRWEEMGRKYHMRNKSV